MGAKWKKRGHKTYLNASEIEKQATKILDMCHESWVKFEYVEMENVQCSFKQKKEHEIKTHQELYLRWDGVIALKIGCLPCMLLTRGTIFDIPYDALSSAGVNSEWRCRNEPWALLDVKPKNFMCEKK